MSEAIQGHALIASLRMASFCLLPRTLASLGRVQELKYGTWHEMRYKEFISDSQFKLFPRLRLYGIRFLKNVYHQKKQIWDNMTRTNSVYSIQMPTPRSWSVHDKDILAFRGCEPLFVLLDLPARKRGTSPKSVEISAYRVWGLLVRITTYFTIFLENMTKHGHLSCNWRLHPAQTPSVAMTAEEYSPAAAAYMSNVLCPPKTYCRIGQDDWCWLGFQWSRPFLWP